MQATLLRSDVRNGQLREKVGITACSDLDNLAWLSFYIGPRLRSGGGMPYKRITPKKLTGQEPFINTGSKQFTVLDFWQYAFSALNSNVLRGALAEFLIENALKDPQDIDVRSPWGDWDVMTPDDTKLEVKCCAYIQDWDQTDYSKIVFSGLKAKGVYYSEAVKSYKDIPTEATYKADIYVLALLHHKDHATLDLLDLNQWSFYVLPRQQVFEITNNGSSISMYKLLKNEIEPCKFVELQNKINTLQD